MKEKLANFFKSKFNISVLVITMLAIILSVMGILGPIFLILGALLFLAASAMMCFWFYKRYEANKDFEPEDEGVFDATKIDFDEDVYNVPHKKNIFKKRKKSKLESMGPVAMFGMLSVVFAVYVVILLVGLFF